jgi:N-acetylated-alpha-linked acidic dipeptidase
MLMKQERLLTRPEGIPRRKWFTHTIYAPGFYTGYGVKTLPGIREAIEERKWQEADEQIGVCAKILTDYAAGIGKIREKIAKESK